MRRTFARVSWVMCSRAVTKKSSYTRGVNALAYADRDSSLAQSSPYAWWKRELP